MRYKLLDKMLGLAMIAGVWCMVILLFAMLLSGCSAATPYVRVGVGAVTNNLSHSEGAALLSNVGVSVDRYHCEWVHFSMINRGPPFNNKPEPSLDWVGCGVQFGAIR